MASKAALSGLDPLKDLLSDVLTRLEALESKLGKAPSSAAAPAAPVKVPVIAAGEVPSIKAYDAYVKSAVVPLAQSCDNLKGLENMGQLLQEAWEGIRTVLVLASRSKMPKEELAEALAPHLAPTQQTVKKIRDLKVGRDYDRHYKAIVEMLSSLSWILYQAPKQLPSPFVKESLASAEFWTNRIRKDFKGKNDDQIAFCDNVKKSMTGLVQYIEEYHKSGLTWNPKGTSLVEAALRLSDDPVSEPDITKSPKSKRHPTLGPAVVSGGNIAGLLGELNKRRSADGSSAATGLKHVKKEQQTWRKEYQKDESESGLPSAPALDSGKKEEPKKKVEKKKKKTLRGLPIFEYQDRGYKWIVENHTRDSVTKELSKNGVVTVEIADPKEQVYLYNCDGISVKIVGKFKSLVIDNCQSCSVVYETLISSAEVVNCKKIQLQVDGVCPVFSIDKTAGCLVWLSEASLPVSSFTTSQSSEMNVSFPDGDDRKEVPIPEQFVHKISQGSLSSDVSDLYH